MTIQVRAEHIDGYAQRIGPVIREDEFSKTYHNLSFRNEGFNHVYHYAEVTVPKSFNDDWLNAEKCDLFFFRVLIDNCIHISVYAIEANGERQFNRDAFYRAAADINTLSSRRLQFANSITTPRAIALGSAAVAVMGASIAIAPASFGLLVFAVFISVIGVGALLVAQPTISLKKRVPLQKGLQYLEKAGFDTAAENFEPTNIQPRGLPSMAERDRREGLA